MKKEILDKVGSVPNFIFILMKREKRKKGRGRRIYIENYNPGYFDLGSTALYNYTLGMVVPLVSLVLGRQRITGLHSVACVIASQPVIGCRTDLKGNHF